MSVHQVSFPVPRIQFKLQKRARKLRLYSVLARPPVSPQVVEQINNSKRGVSVALDIRNSRDIGVYKPILGVRSDATRFSIGRYLSDDTSSQTVSAQTSNDNTLQPAPIATEIPLNNMTLLKGTVSEYIPNFVEAQK